MKIQTNFEDLHDAFKKAVAEGSASPEIAESQQRIDRMIVAASEVTNADNVEEQVRALVRTSAIIVTKIDKGNPNKFFRVVAEEWDMAMAHLKPYLDNVRAAEDYSPPDPKISPAAEGLKAILDPDVFFERVSSLVAKGYIDCTHATQSHRVMVAGKSIADAARSLVADNSERTAAIAAASLMNDVSTAGPTVSIEDIEKSCKESAGSLFMLLGMIKAIGDGSFKPAPQNKPKQPINNPAMN